MTQAPLAHQLAAFSAGFALTGAPAAVVHKAKLCIADNLAASLRIESSPDACAALDAMCPPGSTGAASIVGKRRRASPDIAAFVNSVSAGSTACNDTHTPSATHPGITLVPPVLALAEATAAPGARVLESLIVGYEVMCRLGRALITPSVAAIFRPTGLVGPTAAAAASAHLLGLDTTQTRNAISLATNTAGGFNEWAQAGTHEVLFHSGFAGRNAITAAWLSQHGVAAAQTIFEGKAGIFAAFSALPAKDLLTNGLGTEFEILGIINKPAPACIFAQGPSQLAVEAVARHPAIARSIESVEIRVTTAAALYPGCDNATLFEQRAHPALSIQFCVASILHSGGIRDQNWVDFRQRPVLELARRCKVVVDRELDQAFPGRNGTRLRIGLLDGTTLEFAQDDFGGMTDDAIRARFIANAKQGTLEIDPEAALDAIMHLEQPQQAGRLFAALAGRPE